MAGVDRTLDRLGASFTARDIMVPRERLECAWNESDAAMVSEHYPDYNIIPMPKVGRLTALYHRDTKCSRQISTEDLVGGSTGIIDLLELLREREFCFVLMKNEIAGYVHFSDLNNALVKLNFYVIFEAFERHLLVQLGPLSSKDPGDFEQILGPGSVKRIREEMGKAQINGANLSWLNFLFLPQIVRLARPSGKLDLPDEQISNIRTFRNRVSHAGWLLVENRADVPRLADAKRTCLTVLEGNTG